MRVEFTESSFAYGLTSELVDRFDARRLGPPEFISTRKEGEAGGGWDMRLGPLFLQFKVPTVLTRRSARRREPLSPLSYRMYLHRRRGWRQHELLLQVERDDKRNVVRYASPRFDTNAAFAKAYSARSIARSSIFVPPAAIAIPTDTAEHYIAYSPSDKRAFVCSDPIELSVAIDGASFLEDVEHAIRQATTIDSRALLRDTLSLMKIAIGSYRPTGGALLGADESSPGPPLRGVDGDERRAISELETPAAVVFASISNLSVEEQIGFLAATYLGAVALLI